MPTTTTPTAETPNAPAPETQAATPPQAAQPETATTTTTPTKPTDQLRETLKSDEAFWNRILPKKAEKKEEKAEPEQKAEEKKEEEAEEAKPEQKAEETPEAETPKEEEEKKEAKPKRKKREEFDPQQLIEASASAGAKAAMEAYKAARAPEEQAPAPATEIADPDQFAKQLPDEWAEDADTYLEMARLFPDKYKELPQKLVAYSKAEEAYIRKWQREHQGEQFDPDADEHADWYESNTPDFDSRDFKKAERSFIKRQVTSEIEREVKPQLEELRTSKRQQEVQPVIQKESMQVIGEILGGIKPDYAELVSKPEQLGKLAETDQLGAEVAARVADEALPLVQAAITLYNGVVAYDGSNASHKQLFQLIVSAEDKISRLPLNEQLDNDGKRFARREDYMKMGRAEQQRHWYVGQDEVIEIVTGQAKARAEKLYKTEQTRLEAWAKAHGYSKAGESTKPQTKPAAPETKSQPQQQQAASETAAPSVTGRAAAASGATPSSDQAKTGADMFFQRLLGK